MRLSCDLHAFEVCSSRDVIGCYWTLIDISVALYNLISLIRSERRFRCVSGAFEECLMCV